MVRLKLRDAELVSDVVFIKLILIASTFTLISVVVLS